MKSFTQSTKAPGRIVLAAEVPAAQTNLLTHMIDRACVDRCFSYANYEPSTLAFRLRAIAPNPVVVSNYDHSLAMQAGDYTISLDDMPLLQANLCPGEKPVIIALKAGQTAGLPNCPNHPKTGISPTTLHP